MSLFNPWLVFALIFIVIWAALFIFVKHSRREILWASIFTAPFGLTEPLFVPEYWSPPSLFDLNVKTGFDIESIIWCFAVAGIAAVLFEAIFRKKHQKMSKNEMHAQRHHLHFITLILPIPVFLILFFTMSLNIIYISIITLFIGSVSALFCRPDLKKKMIFGGLLFLILYFTVLFFWTLWYQSITESIWNLQAISGVLILKVPLEELLFAIAFGMLWSSYYEHVKWYKMSHED